MISYLVHQYKTKAKAFDENRGTIPWSLKTYVNCYGFTKTYGAGFLCPKCQEYKNNTLQPPFCTCEDWIRGHFHFVCSSCKFKAIMRTKDNKGDNES